MFTPRVEQVAAGTAHKAPASIMGADTFVDRRIVKPVGTVADRAGGLVTAEAIRNTDIVEGPQSSHPAADDMSHLSQAVIEGALRPAGAEAPIEFHDAA